LVGQYLNSFPFSIEIELCSFFKYFTSAVSQKDLAQAKFNKINSLGQQNNYCNGYWRKVLCWPLEKIN